MKTKNNITNKNDVLVECPKCHSTYYIDILDIDRARPCPICSVEVLPIKTKNGEDNSK